MDRRNVVFSVVQDRSKIQTFTPNLFAMSNQAQETAEKCVQTHDLSSTPATVLVTNNPENTAAEVANTLVSMATGRQRGIATVKQLNVINVPTPSATSSSSSSTLPIISLADYTTSHGVPTATALANQAKLNPLKQDSILENSDGDTSMLTDEYDRPSSHSNSSVKSRRGKSNKSISNSKNAKQTAEPIQYGPLLVKPRKQIAPTLANGRKSKDEQLPPEENVKRQQRRDRNKQAAAKCRRKRNELRERLEEAETILSEEQQTLERSVQNLADQKNQLELLLNRHACLKKIHLPTTNNLNIAKTDVKTTSTNSILDPNNSKRVTINFSNAQDLFAVSPLTRVTTTTDSTPSSSSTVPMITIHILPEVAQAFLGSTSVDKARLAELLQQANTINSSSTTTTSDSISTNNSN